MKPITDYSIKNKYKWAYVFLLTNHKHGENDLYQQINTDKGYQVAESAAWGRATWDGYQDMKYIRKERIKLA